MLDVKLYLQYAGLILYETEILDERLTNAQKNPQNQNNQT